MENMGYVSRSKVLRWILLAGCCLAVGCASVHLKWGDVEYTSYGDHALKELHVTRTMPDGTQITVSVGVSDSKEVQAVNNAINLANEAIKRVPVVVP